MDYLWDQQRISNQDIKTQWNSMNIYLLRDLGLD